MKLRDGCLERSRTDLHLTSTGKGLFYQPLQPFPPANFERSYYKTPPNGLMHEGFDFRNDQFKTTTGSSHDQKQQDSSLRNIQYKKSPGHWKVNYLEPAISKLQKEHKRNFTMGDRLSEMTSKYVPKESYPNITEHLIKEKTPVGGPAKTAYGVRDHSLITQINPYLTTTNKDHRPFSSTELSRYPKKDALTFWEFENYPKVWGHGSYDGKNIPPRKNLAKTESMTDRTMGGLAIMSPVKKIPARPSAQHVPNKGLKSLVQASYVRHPGAPRLDLTNVEPPQPFETYFNHGRRRQADTSVCPNMYTTEYQFHGSDKTVRV